MSDGIWHREHEGRHRYGCPSCGHTWAAKGRYPLWPISFFARWKLLTMRDARGRIRWRRLLKWSRHWVEVGGDGPEQRVMMTIIQWLFIGVRLGPHYKNYRSPVMYIPDHGWYPREMGERILAYLATKKEQEAAITDYGYQQNGTTYRKVNTP